MNWQVFLLYLEGITSKSISQAQYLTLFSKRTADEVAVHSYGGTLRFDSQILIKIASRWYSHIEICVLQNFGS